MKTLSVVTTVDKPITKEFYLKELIYSVLDIADEIVIVDGHPDGHTSYSETMHIIDEVAEEIGGQIIHPEINLYFNPWEPRMRSIMPRLQKSIAISHARCDYVLLLDADEVVHEKDHEKIKQAMEMDFDYYATRTLHFYRDFNHIKSGLNPVDPGQVWYNHRTRLFKNGLAVFDMHDQRGNYDCGLIDFHYTPLSEVGVKTSIEVFHVGHVRSIEAYINKTNNIEKSYHPDWEDIGLEEFKWDMSGVIKYRGTYPSCLKERIDLFNENKDSDGVVREKYLKTRS